MLEYLTVGNIIQLNLIIYLTVSLPLDITTYRHNVRERKRAVRPDTKHDKLSVFTYLSSLTIWGLFIGISIEQVFNSNILYHQLLDLGFLGTIFQIIGILIIFCGTIVACTGRISRGNRAFSWGVPIELETDGMYRFLRHPLYASYCYYFIGFPLVLQNPLFLFLLIGIPGYYKISEYEEEILIEYFGREYYTYQHKTKRFIPYLW